MRPNLITRLKEEWNNLDPVDPLRGLIADAIEALEQPAQKRPQNCGTGYCSCIECLFEQPNIAKYLEKDNSEQPNIAKYLEKDNSEQPAQEPVAYSYTSKITGAQGFSHHPMPRFIDSEFWDIKPLYISPPASKSLTDEQIDRLMPPADGSAEKDKTRIEVQPGVWGMEYKEVDAWSLPLVRQAIRATEAAHGIKGDA